MKNKKDKIFNINVRKYINNGNPKKGNSLWDSLVSHTRYYPVKPNLNYLWSFGFLAMISIFIQLITGIMLSTHYTATTAEAFNSIQYIMRDVNNGWFIRYTHMNTASGLFVVLYIHLLRGIYYKSYIKPRQAVWVTGMLLYVLIMATAFTGYVLPWGQMSYWGATVITNLLSIIPIFGSTIVEWIFGGANITEATLKRFYTIHFALPFLIMALSGLHILLLHRVGSSEPLGTGDNTGVYLPFYPYVLLKDLVALIVFLIVLLYVIHFEPLALSHPENLIRANPLVTPKHIVPEWYFLVFYAILRAIPDKILGIVFMFFSIFILFILPVIDRPKITGSCFKPIYYEVFMFWVSNTIFLGWLGAQPTVYPYMGLSQLCTFIYFAFFGWLMLYTWVENKYYMQL